MDEAQQVTNQNPITSVPPIATYSTPQPAPTSKTPWILIALIVILLLIASYFGYQNYQLKQQLTAQQPTPTPALTTSNSPVPVTSAAITADPTASWKTYSNKKYNYTLRYPKNWEPSRGPGNSTDEELSIQRDIDMYDPSLSGGDPGTGLTISVNELNATGASKDCLNLEDCFTKSVNWLEEATMKSKQSTTFLGNPAITFTYQRNTPSYTQSWKYLYFVVGNNAYNIHISTESSREKEIFMTFDQILSTFKFTN